MEAENRGSPFPLVIEISPQNHTDRMFYVDNDEMLFVTTHGAGPPDLLCLRVDEVEG